MTPDGAKALPSCRLCGGEAHTWTIPRLAKSARCQGTECPLRGVSMERDEWEKLMSRTPDPATQRVLEAAKECRMVGGDGAWIGVSALLIAVEALAAREK